MRQSMSRAEHLHKAMVARLGCMVCRRIFQFTNAEVVDTSVELHHIRGGRGWGKGDYTTLIPLCYEHHRGNSGVHGLGTKGFPKHYGFTEEDLLNDTRRLIEEMV